MTLDGTNSFVLRHPDSRGVVVVDPGPLHEQHLGRLTALGQVELILLTHHHLDHSESAQRLSVMTSAPVRAANRELCIGGERLVDGESLTVAGIEIRVVATPGHTADSICLYLPQDLPIDGLDAAGSILTGDTILGRGTTVVASPDGSLRAYLASLRRLMDFGRAIALPAHGPRLEHIKDVASSYLSHRATRLTQVAAASLEIAASGGEITVERVTEVVYPTIAEDVRPAAEAIVRAQLDYLATQSDA